MKKLFLFFVLFFIFIQNPANSPAQEQIFKESRSIRRAFLEVKGIPPTPTELTWYLNYNRNGYEKAITDLLSETLNLRIKSLLKDYLLSEQYKNKNSSILTEKEQLFIIQYQIGNLSVSPEVADKKLVSMAIANRENNYEPLDYIAEALMARPTTAQEETFLAKIIKKYPSEEEGYFTALQIIKTFKDFTHK